MSRKAITHATQVETVVIRQGELKRAGWDETDQERDALDVLILRAGLWAEFATLRPQQAKEFIETQAISRILSSNKDRM